MVPALSIINPLNPRFAWRKHKALWCRAVFALVNANAAPDSIRQ